MHAEALNCINSYLQDSLTVAQARAYIDQIEMKFLCGKADDWRAYVPVNLCQHWTDLSPDLRVGVALMAMGCSVGAVQSYRHPKPQSATR